MVLFDGAQNCSNSVLTSYGVAWEQLCTPLLDLTAGLSTNGLNLVIKKVQTQKPFTSV